MYSRRHRAPRRAIVACSRLFLALVLLATGLGKLFDITGFAGIVDTYGALPHALLLPSAVALTAAELVLAAWLASGLHRRVAAGCSFLLHAGYAAWSAAALWRGLELPNCGCFGVFLAQPLEPTTLVEDGVLGALSLVAMQGARR